MMKKNDVGILWWAKFFFFIRAIRWKWFYFINVYGVQPFCAIICLFV